MLAPIKSDTVSGKPSDHLTVVCEPLNVINNIPQRQKRNITIRPIMESGLELFKSWISSQTWNENIETHSVNHKERMMHTSVMDQIKICFPEKNLKMTSDDAPWCNNKVKRLKRLKCREYNKHRSSTKWVDLNNQYKIVLTEAKHKYYKDIVKDLKTSNPSQWYSKVKRMCSYDQEKFEPIVCNEIETLTDQEQADKIAEHF